MSLVKEFSPDNRSVLTVNTTVSTGLYSHDHGSPKRLTFELDNFPNRILDVKPTLQTTTSELEGIIDDIDAPIYGGGPSLYTHIMGFQHPVFQQSLFVGIDQDQEDESVYHLTYLAANQELAEEVSSKMGIILAHRYGEGAWTAFTQSYRIQQERDFFFDPTKQRWMSREDEQQEKALKEMEHLVPAFGKDDSSVEDSLDAGVDMVDNMQILIAGADRTRSAIPMGDASATTIAGVRLDAVSKFGTEAGGALPSMEGKVHQS